MASVSMTVNGQAVTREVEPRTLLVEFLRQHLDHLGCQALELNEAFLDAQRPGGFQRLGVRLLQALAGPGLEVAEVARVGRALDVGRPFRGDHVVAVVVLDARRALAAVG